MIYDSEGDGAPVQWVEESVPFSGELEVAGCREEMIPVVSMRLVHRDVEAKPDYDGEMREMDAEAVLELDIKLYEEQEAELLSDMYSNGAEIELEQREAAFDQILTRNVCKTKVTEKVSLPQDARILQSLPQRGGGKAWMRWRWRRTSLQIDGVLEVTILYLTER